MKAIIYTRSFNHSMDSNRQLAMCQSHSNTIGLEVIKCLHDEFENSLNIDRDGINKILMMARAKKITAIIVPYLLTITHNVKLLNQFIFEIQKHDVQLISVLDSFSTHTGTGKISMGLWEVMCQKSFYDLYIKPTLEMEICK